MEETLYGSITEPTSASSAGTENSENPLTQNGSSNFGGGVLGDPLAPDEGYEYDLGEDSGLPMRTPFDQLLEFEEFDNVGDIFGDLDPSDNPFAGGATSEDVSSNIDGNAQPNVEGDSAFGGNSNNPSNDSNPNTNSESEMPFSGDGSMMNADFSGSDTGTDNVDNGNGNNFVGDSEGESGSNNQADGSGNWFYGNDNQANGNGNWSYGDGNQVEGNGNWNLNEEDSSPFNSIFAGENNPLTGGNPQGAGSEGGISADAIDGNNPIFAGGSTMPTPVGEGELPDTAENPTGNQNTVSGNGNWNFGSDNNTSGNGNWNFGDGNVVTDGNANWNLGDNNEVSGNGNRPSGNDNSISGNSNRISGDGNSVNGNRFNLDEDNSNLLGNADRYLQTDADGNVTLVSDESASDPNYTFDYSGVVEASADSEVDESLNENDDPAGQDIMNQVYGSLNSDGMNSLPNDSGAPSENEDALVVGSFGGGAADQSTSDAESQYVYDFSSFEGGQQSGGNSFGGGAGGFGGGQQSGGNPFGGGAGGFGGGQQSGGNSFGGGAGGFGGGQQRAGNPFGGGAGGFGGGQQSGGNPFGGGAGGFGGGQQSGGNSFGGGAGGFGGGQQSGGNPFGGGAGGFGTGVLSGNNDASTMDGSEGGQQSGGDLNELLAQSPFGRLLDIPGIEGAEDIFGNIGGSAGGFGGSASGEDDSAPAMGGSEGGAPNGNPFANFNPLEDGNPFVEGDEPNISFGGAGGFGGGQQDSSENSAPTDGSEMENADSESYSEASPEASGNYNYDFSSFGDGQQSGGNPFSSGAGGQQSGGGNPLAGGFSGGQMGGGNSFGGGAEGGEQNSQSDLNELIRQSPFGVLLDIPGIESAEDIFGNVGGENPFGGGAGGASGAGGGNPFGGGAGGASGAGGGNPFANFNPLEEGNPFVEGDEPDISGAGGAGGFGGGQQSGGNPFSDGAGGAGSGNPFSGGSSLGSLPETGEVAIGDSAGYVVRDDEGNWYTSEDDILSDDDTSLSNPEVFSNNGAESEGNPFGGSPFEYNPIEDLSNSSDAPAESVFPVGEVPEGLSDEELAASSQITDGENAPAMESNSNYNWDFDFAGFNNFNSDSSDGSATESADEEPLLDGMDLDNSQAEDGENTDTFSGPVFNAETNELLLPNGVTVNPSNENGELDISLNAPVFNNEGIEAGNIKISFPEFVEDYYSSVFNSEDMMEVFSGGGSEMFSAQFSDIEGNPNIFGSDAPVLGEDNVLQVPGGFEIDLSEIIGESADDAVI